MLRWYFGPEHIAKQRLWRYVLNAMNNPRLSVRYGGSSVITLDYRDWLQHQIMEKGAYEPEVWSALSTRAVTGEVFWDVGANIGTFTIPALRDDRIATVHSFEPAPNVNRILREHVRLNGGDSCHIHQLALSSRNEECALTFGPAINSGMASLARGALPETKSCVVPCFTIDTLVYGQGFESPTLMKVDVEGWELEVLRGASRVHREAPPKTIVFEAECNGDGAIVDPAICRLLEGYGYGVAHIARPSGEIEPRENYVAVHGRSPGATRDVSRM